jgi:EamA-like transporter family
VVVTVAGLFLWLHLLRTVPARTAASVQYLQPVVGIAASSAMFGDTLGVLFVAGVILILGDLDSGRPCAVHGLASEGSDSKLRHYRRLLFIRHLDGDGGGPCHRHGGTQWRGDAQGDDHRPHRQGYVAM